MVQQEHVFSRGCPGRNELSANAWGWTVSCPLVQRGGPLALLMTNGHSCGMSLTNISLERNSCRLTAYSVLLTSESRRVAEKSLILGLLVSRLFTFIPRHCSYLSFISQSLVTSLFNLRMMQNMWKLQLLFFVPSLTFFTCVLLFWTWPSAVFDAEYKSSRVSSRISVKAFKAEEL